MDSGRVEESIKYSISKNGFPEKRVKLPFKPVFDCCKQNGTSLAEVLQNLAKENISGTIKGDFIEFQNGFETVQKETGSEGRKGVDGDLGDLQRSAAEMLSRMSPDQIANLRQMVEGLSEEEKKHLMDMAAGKIKPPS